MNKTRTQELIGVHSVHKLAQAHVIIFGIGGVGGYVAEALCRAGVGTLTLVDGDVVDSSNVNRQIVATQQTIGELKVNAMKERLLSINDEIVVNTHPYRYNDENKSKFNFDYDYIADCIDSVKDKKLLILQSRLHETRIVCAMGAGRRTCIPDYRLSDIMDTRGDSLARVIRKFCREANISSLNCVYSDSTPQQCDQVIGSIVYHPMAMASIITAKIVNDIIKGE